MGVEKALIFSYILKRESQPPLDFQRPPYSPAGTHKRHGCHWLLETIRTYRVAAQHALLYSKASEISRVWETEISAYEGLCWVSCTLVLVPSTLGVNR